MIFSDFLPLQYLFDQLASHKNSIVLRNNLNKAVQDTEDKENYISCVLVR